MNGDLGAALERYFELVHAADDELRMHVYRLRYQVYVLETGFERIDGCGRGSDDRGQPYYWEMDEFDRRADHYLLRHRASGLFAATARLILPEPGDLCQLFPIERHCDLSAPVAGAGRRRQLGEISRFAVSKAFKKRLGEAGTLAGVAQDVDRYFDDDPRRVLPHLSLGLFAAVMRMMHAHRITFGYAVMEPALKRLLSRFGVVFEPIGPETDYHGVRIPCLITADKTLTDIKRTAPPVWDFITEHGRLAA